VTDHQPALAARREASQPLHQLLDCRRSESARRAAGAS